MSKELAAENQKNQPSNGHPNLTVKPKQYPTPQALQDKINEFFLYLSSHTKEVMSASGQIKLIADPLVPTIEYLCAYLELRKDALRMYENAEGYEDYHDIVGIAKEKILGQKTLGLMNNKANARYGIFDLVNNHGYIDKQQVESDNKNETIIKVVYDD